jgi:hypothetical protein
MKRPDDISLHRCCDCIRTVHDLSASLTLFLSLPFPFVLCVTSCTRSRAAPRSCRSSRAGHTTSAKNSLYYSRRYVRFHLGECFQCFASRCAGVGFYKFPLSQCVVVIRDIAQGTCDKQVQDPIMYGVLY